MKFQRSSGGCPLFFEEMNCRESGNIFRQNAAVDSKTLDGAVVGRLSRFLVNIAFPCSSTALHCILHCKI